MSIRQVFLPIAFLFAVPAVTAGEIQLTNGDRLAGELVSIGDTNVLWNSATMGNLRIAKEAILAITSNTPLKLRGRDDACYWQELRGTRVVFACDNGDLTFEPLYSLDQVVPYVTAMEDFYQHNGTIVLSGSRFAGNVEQQSWLVDTEFVMRYGDVRHTARFDYEARSFAEEELVRLYEGRYLFDWFFATRGYWQNELAARTDEGRGIQERYSYGSGLGYEFWSTPIALLSMELGARYEKTLFDRTPPLNPNLEYRNETGLWRWSARFNYQLPLEITFRHQTQYFQPMDDSQAWRLESDTGVSLPLGFGISANVNYEYDYDNAAPEYNENADSVLRFGLDYSW